MLQPNPSSAATLIGDATRKRQLANAFKVYESLIQSSQKPDAFVFGALINACRKCGQPKKGLSLLSEMKQHPIRYDDFCFGSLVSACMETNDYQNAKNLLQVWKVFYNYNYNYLCFIFNIFKFFNIFYFLF